MTQLLRFGHEAMATHFEIVIASDDPDYANQAAEAAFADIDQLESELSRFKVSSDVSQLRSLKAGQSSLVGLATFDCLSLARQVFEETDGAFDVTIGPLYKLWRTRDGLMKPPPTE